MEKFTFSNNLRCWNGLDRRLTKLTSIDFQKAKLWHQISVFSSFINTDFSTTTSISSKLFCTYNKWRISIWSVKWNWFKNHHLCFDIQQIGPSHDKLMNAIMCWCSITVPLKWTNLNRVRSALFVSWVNHKTVLLWTIIWANANMNAWLCIWIACWEILDLQTTKIPQHSDNHWCSLCYSLFKNFVLQIVLLNW